MIKTFIMEEEGATAVEYSILGAAIAAVIVAVVWLIGARTGVSFTNFYNDFSNLS